MKMPIRSHRSAWLPTMKSAGDLILRSRIGLSFCLPNLSELGGVGGSLLSTSVSNCSRGTLFTRTACFCCAGDMPAREALSRLRAILAAKAIWDHSITLRMALPLTFCY